MTTRGNSSSRSLHHQKRPSSTSGISTQPRRKGSGLIERRAEAVEHPVCTRPRFLYWYPETQLAEPTKQSEQDLLSQPLYPPLTTGLSGPGPPMSGVGSFKQNKGHTWTQKTWKKRNAPKKPEALYCRTMTKSKPKVWARQQHLLVVSVSVQTTCIKKKKIRSAQNTRSSQKFLTTNAQSLFNKMDELQERCQLNQPLFICVTETWCVQSEPESLYSQ